MKLDGITCVQEACVPPGGEGALQATARNAGKELHVGLSLLAGPKATNGIGTIAEPGEVYETEPLDKDPDLGTAIKEGRVKQYPTHRPQGRWGYLRGLFLDGFRYL